MEQSPSPPPSLFVSYGVPSAISKASQSQSILIVCIQGHSEGDEKIEIELWQNSEVSSLLKDCICLRLWDGTNEAEQFKEYYKFTETPTIYFFGLKQTTLLVIEGYITFGQFSEKFNAAKEIFLKQVNDIQQIMQLLLLQQLQNTQTQASTTSTTSNLSLANASNVNINTAINNNNSVGPTKGNTSPPSISTSTKTTPVPIKTTSPSTPSTKTNSPSPTSSNNNPTPKNIKFANAKNTVTTNPVERHVSSLAFRLTNGHVIKAQFSPSDTLNTAIDFIDKNRTDGRHKYVLMTVYPKRVFRTEEYDSTLSQLEIVPSSTLVLVATDPTAKPLPHLEASVSASPSPSPSPPHPPSSASSASSSGGMLSSVTNYVWSFFGSNTPSNTSNYTANNTSNNNSETAGKKNGSYWEYNYDSKKEEAVRNNNNQQQDTEVSSVGIRNRKNVHQLNDNAKKDDEDKNSYWNGNSTQFQ